MLIYNLNCKNYRNLSDINIPFSERMNVICGENAQGKTNILEAVWLFTGAKSFRNTADSEFIKFGETAASVKIKFNGQKTDNDAEIRFGDKKTAFFNGKKLSIPSKLAGNFSAVVFSPTDLQIINGGPEKRRRFIDVSIGQLYPQYIDFLREYIRAVKHRNEIIKEYKYDATAAIMLDTFETEIAFLGGKVTDYRKKYVSSLLKYLPEIYDGISSGREDISVFYGSTAENLEAALKESRKTDKFTGTTSVGPHRDDLVVKIKGVSARGYGSQGQQRSAAIALKLAAAEVIKEHTGEYPVCLLDDVMSELDVKRQNYILNHIESCQSFITCCDPSNTERLKSGKIIEVREGRVV